MKNIAVFSKKINEIHFKTVIELFKKLDNLNCNLILNKSLFEFITPHYQFKSEVLPFEAHTQILNSDFLISIGGDGTLLDTISYIRDSGIPVIGFNIGRLGFLANTTITDIDNALKLIINNNFSLDKRSLVRMESPILDNNDINFALNDVVIHKSYTASMIKINVSIDDYHVNTYWADGLIISTPTGSTAYSLSCGGPIVVPDTNNFIITPIASHNLTVRPIVVSDSSKIKLKVDAAGESYVINLDSRKIKTSVTSEIVLSKELFSVNLIKLNNFDFFSTIRNKLLWGVDKRN